MAGYAPDCTFADPFVSFTGVDRFKRNVANLGGLMSDVGRQQGGGGGALARTVCVGGAAGTG
jgi:hypothetical protein